jgi:type II secretory pathway pseudopilin PulG
MSDTDKKLGAGAFVVGGLSFIPLFGVLFGIIAIVWGLVSQKKGGKALALVGAGGIAFTVVAYGALFYFGTIQRGGIYDDLRRKLAQRQLGQLVQSIEFYKVANGEYPTSLQQLQEAVRKNKNTTIFIHDPTDVNIAAGPRYLYYERVGTDRYYLRSVGPDGQPFTADDIVPQVNDALLPKLGLLIAPPIRP